MGFGSASFISQGFSSPDGAILGPILMPDATVVVKVIAAPSGRYVEVRGRAPRDS